MWTKSGCSAKEQLCLKYLKFALQSLLQRRYPAVLLQTLEGQLVGGSAIIYEGTLSL